MGCMVHDAKWYISAKRGSIGSSLWQRETAGIMSRCRICKFWIRVYRDFVASQGGKNKERRKDKLLLHESDDTYIYRHRVYII